MKVLIIADYRPDGFTSMERYAELVRDALHKHGIVTETVSPPELSILRSVRIPALKKLVGHFSKYIIFPLQLLRKRRGVDIAHIIDHYNALYTPLLGTTATVVTCHDMLAVRAALGENTFVQPSRLGMYLQRAILWGLNQSPVIGSVSTYTQDDLRRLLAQPQAKYLTVVPNPLDPKFSRLDPCAAEEELRKLIPAGQRYILMVGSALPRKNREGAFRAFAMVQKRLNCKLVVAGKRLSEQQTALAARLQIADDLISIEGPSDSLLAALYSNAYALLFPSHGEGFGWPIIEAQFFGCPVVCSDFGPMPEVAGRAALLAASTDDQGFATALVSLQDDAMRNDLIVRGRQNVQRFAIEQFERNLLNLYEEAKQHCRI